MLLRSNLRQTSRLWSNAHLQRSSIAIRRHSTLEQNPAIYIIPTSNKAAHNLSFSPIDSAIAIGTTTALPPTPRSFTENPKFRPILQEVIRNHAASDPEIQAAAKGLYATQMGAANLNSSTRSAGQHRRKRNKSEDGSGGANLQGGMGGAGVGGWLNIADQRNPPEFGRVPDPMDIFGSLEVDSEGGIHGYQECEAYRMVTNEGVVTLPRFLEQRLVERLEGEEKKGGSA